MISFTGEVVRLKVMTYFSLAKVPNPVPVSVISVEITGEAVAGEKPEIIGPFEVVK